MAVQYGTCTKCGTTVLLNSHAKDFDSGICKNCKNKVIVYKNNK